MSGGAENAGGVFYSAGGEWRFGRRRRASRNPNIHALWYGDACVGKQTGGEAMLAICGAQPGRSGTTGRAARAGESERTYEQKRENGRCPAE